MKMKDKGKSKKYSAMDGTARNVYGSTCCRCHEMPIDYIRVYTESFALANLQGYVIDIGDTWMVVDMPFDSEKEDDRPDIDLGGPTLMEPSIHAPANAVPASVELYDSDQ